MKIKEIRIKKNITQKELADAIGVNMSLLSRYETGKTEPTAKRLSAMAKALNVSVDELLESSATELNDEDAQETIDNTSSKKKRLTSYASLIQNDYVRRIIILGAGGKCELCGADAPFKDKKGKPFLEIRPLYDDYNIRNEEIEKKVVALCPNCNRKLDILNDPTDLEKLRKIAEKHDY